VVATDKATYLVDRRRLGFDGNHVGLTGASGAVARCLPVGSFGRTLGVTPPDHANQNPEALLFENGFMSPTGPLLITGQDKTDDESGPLRLMFPPEISVILRGDDSPVTNVQALSNQSSDEVALALSWFRKSSTISESSLRNSDSSYSEAITNPVARQHHHLRVDVSGDLGKVIHLAVESTDAKGSRLNQNLASSFPALLTDQQLQSRALRAFRMSDDRHHWLYNVYVSDPILLTDDEPDDEITARVADVPGRRILQAGKSLRVSIENSEDNALLGLLRSPAPSNDLGPPVGVSQALRVLRFDDY
jgi:hypothetical protein